MKSFLSHFQVTPKNVLALVAAVTGYLVLRGRMTTEERQSYLLIASALLSFLVPSRAPGANVDPDTQTP